MRRASQIPQNSHFSSSRQTYEDPNDCVITGERVIDRNQQIQRIQNSDRFLNTRDQRSYPIVGHPRLQQPIGFPAQQVSYHMIPNENSKNSYFDQQKEDRLNYEDKLAGIQSQEIGKHLVQFYEKNKDQNLRGTIFLKIINILNNPLVEEYSPVQKNIENIAHLQPVVEEEQDAEVDLTQIKQIKQWIEVMPDKAKLKRFKILIKQSPFKSKILVFTNGPKTIQFLKDRLSSEIEGYELVSFDSYSYNPDIGQVILLGDRDVNEMKKFPKTHIGIHYSYPNDVDTFHNRLALYSGKGNRYSITLIGTRDENKIELFKQMFESLDAIKDSPIFTKYYETITIMEKEQASDKDKQKEDYYNYTFDAIMKERIKFALPRGTAPVKKENSQQQTSFGGNQNTESAGWGSAQANQQTSWENPQKQENANSWGNSQAQDTSCNWNQIQPQASGEWNSTQTQENTNSRGQSQQKQENNNVWGDNQQEQSNGHNQQNGDSVQKKVHFAEQIVEGW